ncbi:MAG TPA: hypothetical protein PKB09_00420 [Candidatus Saccharibacteria bacterium]|nr:hypothetical protein [Candidatus Saccharibacteria bacterium]
MFNKKFAIFGALIIFVVSLGGLLIAPTHYVTNSVRAESGYQWIEGAGGTILEDKLGLTGDALDEALAQYESNTGGIDPYVGSFMIGKNCDDSDKLEDDITPVCDEYYTFAESLGVNPPHFQEICRLSDDCGEPESIALLNFTTGCRIVTFSGAPRICTTSVTINNPFDIRRRSVKDEFDIDFEAIDGITQDDVDDAIEEPPGGDPIGVDEPEPDGPQTCDENFKFTGGFLVCIVLGVVDKTVDSMVNSIANMLQVERAEVNDDGLKTAWSYFRNIASVLLVVIGLVMIIGQAISKE